MEQEIKIDRLIRSRRRTIGLQITADARLVVRAPYSISESYIHKLIRGKASWIRSKQEYFRQRQGKFQPRKFVPGEEFMFLGQAYVLSAVEDLSKAVVFDGGLKISMQVLANARDHLENWYRAQALSHITQRVGHYAAIEGLKYTSIRVNEATTRWGSCGYTNSLNFTWRLIMAPPLVVDYVVVHELMHFKQKNHSRKFWAEVARVMPDYKEHERWLKQSSHLLRWE